MITSLVIVDVAAVVVLLFLGSGGELQGSAVQLLMVNHEVTYSGLESVPQRIESPFGPCVDLLGRYSALVDEELGPESFVE